MTLFQATDILFKNIVLIKTEFDTALNRLCSGKSSNLGDLILAEDGLSKFLSIVKNQVSETKSEYVKRGLTKLQGKLEKIEKKSKFPDS